MMLDDLQSNSRNTLSQRLHLDMPLLLGLLVLAGLGLVTLYSAGDQSETLVMKQLMRLGVAFAAMFAVAQISPETWRRWTPWLYAIGMALYWSAKTQMDSGEVESALSEVQPMLDIAKELEE